jgi:hypothetical protein
LWMQSGRGATKSVGCTVLYCTSRSIYYLKRKFTLKKTIAGACTSALIVLGRPLDNFVQLFPRDRRDWQERAPFWFIFHKLVESTDRCFKVCFKSRGDLTELCSCHGSRLASFAGIRQRPQGRAGLVEGSPSMGAGVGCQQARGN